MLQLFAWSDTLSPNRTLLTKWNDTSSCSRPMRLPVSGSLCCLHLLHCLVQDLLTHHASTSGRSWKAEHRWMRRLFFVSLPSNASRTRARGCLLEDARTAVECVPIQSRALQPAMNSKHHELPEGSLLSDIRSILYRLFVFSQ